MAKIAALSKPPLCHSKLLCFSFLYLLSALLFALHVTFSDTKCRFLSSPLLHPLFSYPPSYGEHKHAIPSSRSSCNSPVYFSDYSAALKEMLRINHDSRASPLPSALRYLQGNAPSFGGNLSVQKRISYFDYREDGLEIPCGFFKRLPISYFDRVSMEKCDGLVVASAIFNDHDKIRQPRGIGAETLNYACFFMFVDDATLDRLHFQNLISRKSKESKIGAWRIVRVSSKQLYDNPAMNGVIPKYLMHRLFPNSKYSIWMDAKLQLVVDPFLLIHSLVAKENVDMAISKHPFFLHTMEEAMATARWKKWDVNAIKLQMETYCENGLQPWNANKPYPTDVPDTALILRKHSVESNLFSCLMFNELDGFNPRDQLAFAYVRDKMRPQLKLNMVAVEVFEQVAIEYRHNLKHGGLGAGPRTKRASPELLVNGTRGKCDGYLSRMWGESHD